MMVVGVDGRQQVCSITGINGKRLGIVGMGAIGQAIARRARGFGMSIHYHNRKPVQSGVEEALEATYWESLRSNAASDGYCICQLPLY